MYKRWQRRNAMLEGRPHAPGATGQIQGLYFGSPNRKKEMNSAIKQSYSKRAPQARTFMPKGFPTRAKLDAKTHPKTMPTYESKKENMDITGETVFLICRIILIHYKNIDCLTFCSLRTRNENVSNNHQQ